MLINQIISLVFLGLLVAIFAVIGLQLVLFLIELRKTLHKFNLAADTAGAKLNSLIKPLEQISVAAVGFKTGMKALEAVMEWVGEKRRSAQSVALVGEVKDRDSSTDLESAKKLSPKESSQKK